MKCPTCHRPRRSFLPGTESRLYCILPRSVLCLEEAYWRAERHAAEDALVQERLWASYRRERDQADANAQALSTVINHHRKLLNDTVDVAQKHAATAHRYEQVLREVDRMCNEDFLACPRCDREEPLKDLDLHYIVRNALRKFTSENA